MNREQILRAFLEDEMLVSKGYLKEGEGANAKWVDTKHPKLVQVLKLAIEGVASGESQTLMTRKVNQLLDKSE